MTQAERWSVVSSINAEKDALQHFVELLNSEQSVLLAADTDGLLALAEQKTAAAAELMRMAETRQAFASARNITNWSQWLTENHPALYESWSSLADLAQQTHQLNKINGELIQVRLRHNQQALSVLNRAAQKAELYGPDGQSNSGGNARNFGAA